MKMSKRESGGKNFFFLKKEGKEEAGEIVCVFSQMRTPVNRKRSGRRPRRRSWRSGTLDKMSNSLRLKPTTGTYTITRPILMGTQP